MEQLEKLNLCKQPRSQGLFPGLGAAGRKKTLGMRWPLQDLVVRSDVVNRTQSNWISIELDWGRLKGIGTIELNRTFDFRSLNIKNKFLEARATSVYHLFFVRTKKRLQMCCGLLEKMGSKRLGPRVPLWRGGRRNSNGRNKNTPEWQLCSNLRGQFTLLVNNQYYNIDRTLCELWLIKNLCFIRV